MNRDSQNVALCDRLLDAIERRDFAALDKVYAPECIIWHSSDCLYQQRDDNIARLKDALGTVKKIEYLDRLTRPFEGGFVVEYTVTVVRDNGFVGKMECCLIAHTRDGMISRMYQYWCHNRIDEFLGPDLMAAQARKVTEAGRGQTR